MRYVREISLHQRNPIKGRAFMLSLQTELYQELPPVFGSKDFRELQALLERIDELIVQGGLESAFVASFPFKARKTQKQRRRLVEAFRCTLLRMMFDLSYRLMSCDLACNFLYQKFCGLRRLDHIKVPSASTLERYEPKKSS